jgi:hypothetical protein
MSVRRLPVRPDLEQLKHQAKDLLRAARHGDPAALEEFREHHPRQVDPASARLADAQLVLARSYQSPSWPRLVVACQLVSHLGRRWEAVRAIIARHPQVLHETC